MYNSLLTLPEALTSEDVLPLKSTAQHLLKIMLESNVFYILPKSELGTQNPRHLPREVVKELAAVSSSTTRKKGRPSKRSRVARTKAAVEGLNKLAQKSFGQLEPPEATLQQYQGQKAELLNSINASSSEGFSALEKANLAVLERLQQVNDSGEDNTGITRAMQAVDSLKTLQGRRQGGLLGLLDGGGKGANNENV